MDNFPSYYNYIWPFLAIFGNFWPFLGLKLTFLLLLLLSTSFDIHFGQKCNIILYIHTIGTLYCIQFYMLPLHSLYTAILALSRPEMGLERAKTAVYRAV